MSFPRTSGRSSAKAIPKPRRSLSPTARRVALVAGRSRDVIDANVHALRAAGYPERDAVRIALRYAQRASR